MKTLKLSVLENIVYDFEPSPLVIVSRAAAFIRLNSNVKVFVGDSYFRVSLREDLMPSGSKVYVAKLCRPRMRTGVSFSSESPNHLLESVFDYILQYDIK